MSPEQIAKSGSESAHQKALFAWAAMASHWGFDVANNIERYTANGQNLLALEVAGKAPTKQPVAALRWLHSIPNGGARDPITAARMKAEGLRRGVADVFLPVARQGVHGLYIEMKKEKTGRQSEEQKEFRAHCEREGFAYVICTSWKDAAGHLMMYLT